MYCVIDGARTAAGPSNFVARQLASGSFIDASWNRTQLAEVDATAASLTGGEMRSVCQTESS
jgi:hypothetical protein